MPSICARFDDQQAKPGQGREHRQARAQHDAGAPFVRREPGCGAFGAGQGAVQAGHRLAGEARAQARLQLRRQADFRHQQQGLCLRISGEQPLDRRQVDLGLAAAGHAVQQQRRKAGRCRHGVRSALLFRVQRRRGVLGPFHRGVDRACAQPLQRRRPTRPRQRPQQRRQGSDRNLPPGMLVVLGGKPGEGEPVLVQRRDLAEPALHRPDPLFGKRRGFAAGDADPDGVAPAQLDDAATANTTVVAVSVHPVGQRLADGQIDNDLGIGARSQRHPILRILRRISGKRMFYFNLISPRRPVDNSVDKRFGCRPTPFRALAGSGGAERIPSPDLY
jgi:hypothetical protein